jgi:6-pyruvoyltetrahydropterin/6-carboxytetrahydropterin synthase
MVTLIYKTHFDAAHYLPGYDGPCAQLHGHTWRVDVELAGTIDPQTGMILDFKKIKEVLGSILPDHDYLNKILTLPTAENLAIYLFYAVQKELPGLKSLTVWESDHAAAKYTENQGVALC